jgi:hypothetical protein
MRADSNHDLRKGEHVTLLHVTLFRLEAALAAREGEEEDK